MPVHPDKETGKHDLARLGRFYFGLRCQDGLAQSSLEKLESVLRLGLFGVLAPRAQWVEDVTPQLAQECVDSIAGDPSRGPASARDFRAAMRAMWNRLRAEGVYELANPWTLTKRPATKDACHPVDPAHFRIIDAECRAVTVGESDTVSVPFAYAIRCLARSGCRKMEILSLSWPQVDFDRQEATIHDHKGKRHGPKVVNLSPAIAIYRELRGRRLHEHWCFPGRRSHLRHVHRQWKKLAALVGHPECRIHDMRHGFAVQMLEAGASLRDVQKALGHRDIKSTAIYDRIRVSQRARSVANDAMRGVFGE